MLIKMRIPDYEKKYPTASKEVINVLKRSERKLRYLEYDLKVERFVLDETKQVAFFIPSREDSLERLIDADVQFVDDETNVEDMAIEAVMIAKLKESLGLLSAEELEMIHALFYQGLTEREYAKNVGIPQKTINDRKARILRKLKKLLENQK
ncbi:sigma-70 family RNA polymerase sigma factor [Fusibacter paucivorans]|jgi:RNA polymerase sigma factor (sigma-70 family)|uniref:Sigma-70 family RNA polymerase sigma factor n=1 Tax=Fusibacter paucivorans TaxID=76009 RepID=A0ABS5PPY0_9FIRM|nr:sigma factor-like helix-turn-helix DNA-binding protein [Fusibacter paucivorans]MBS7527118.1 sigma-70 family RNA polymerase sigma factor [Fusibacter paucivorans]